MTRTSIFILGLSAALAFPAVASANCGTIQGSFSVTCPHGVQVIRHNAPSGIPRGLTPAQASLQAAQLQAKTNRLRIKSQERNSIRAAELREREIVQDEFRSRIINQNIRRRSFNSFGFGGFGSFGSRNGLTLAQPVRIRSGSLNVQH